MARQIELGIIDTKELTSSYRELFSQVLEFQDGGMPIPLMRTRMKVLDALETTRDGDMLILEDSEWATLKQALETYPWRKPFKAVLDMVDAVEKAEECKISKKEAA